MRYVHVRIDRRFQDEYLNSTKGHLTESTSELLEELGLFYRDHKSTDDSFVLVCETDDDNWEAPGIFERQRLSRTSGVIDVTPGELYPGVPRREFNISTVD